jgi:hypothetical protein
MGGFRLYRLGRSDVFTKPPYFRALRREPLRPWLTKDGIDRLEVGFENPGGIAISIARPGRTVAVDIELVPRDRLDREAMR